MTRDVVTSDGVTPRAQDSGPASGATVVLLAGYTAPATSWAFQVDALVAAGGVRGVVSVDQTPKMINEAGWSHGFYGLTDANSGVLFAEGVPPTGRGAPMDAAAFTRLVERAGPECLPGTTRPETLPLLRDHVQQDWRDVVTRTDVPVLMRAARGSQVRPCEHAAASVEGNPQGRAVVLEDCGHAANMERPDAVNAELLTFLREL